MKNLLIFIITAILAMTSVSAATISGSVYDTDLTKLKDIVIEVNSTPTQTYVSKDGNYAFRLPKGSYIIAADYQGVASAKENISIAEEGNYTLDLILFPIFDEIEEDTTEAPMIPDGEGTSLISAMIIAAILMTIFIIIKKLRKPKILSESEKTAEESTKEDLTELMSVIKKLGGRTTQKDLRKELPYSEAKISLMLTELEHKKKIERIKKGRGKIIILK